MSDFSVFCSFWSGIHLSRTCSRPLRSLCFAQVQPCGKSIRFRLRQPYGKRLRLNKCCPLYPRKRANSGHLVMSASLIGRLGQALSGYPRSGVDVARGLALLFGLGTRALPSWDSKTRWNNLWRDLAVNVTAGSSGHTNSPHPSSREGHHSTVGWSSGFLVFDLILCSSHAAATSLVHRKSVPSIQMRCMITASRRASATIAFFIPRCLAIFIAQALSQDHFVERTSMLWAAS